MYPAHQDAGNETMETSSVSDEMAGLEKDVIDLYSHILLLMSTDQENCQLNMVNQKLASLIDKMSPEFREMIKSSTLENVIRVLNASKSTEASS